MERLLSLSLSPHGTIICISQALEDQKPDYWSGEKNLMKNKI